MNKLVTSFVVAFSLLCIFCAFLEGGGGIVVTTLTAPMTATEIASITVDNTTGFMSTGILFIENEKVSYTGIPDTTHFIGLGRHAEDTTAKPHKTGVTVYNEPAGVLNTALGFNTGVISASGSKLALIAIPWNFFSITLPKLLTWNFWIFQGDLIIARYVLMSVSIAFYVVFAIQLLGALLQAVRP